MQKPKPSAPMKKGVDLYQLCVLSYDASNKKVNQGWFDLRAIMKSLRKRSIRGSLRFRLTQKSQKKVNQGWFDLCELLTSLRKRSIRGSWYVRGYPWLTYIERIRWWRHPWLTFFARRRWWSYPRLTFFERMRWWRYPWLTFFARRSQSGVIRFMWAPDIPQEKVNQG